MRWVGHDISAYVSINI